MPYQYEKWEQIYFFPFLFIKIARRFGETVFNLPALTPCFLIFGVYMAASLHQLSCLSSGFNSSKPTIVLRTLRLNYTKGTEGKHKATLESAGRVIPHARLQTAWLHCSEQFLGKLAVMWTHPVVTWARRLPLRLRGLGYPFLIVTFTSFQ